MIRRALFQIHLWAGLAIGLWAFGIGLTGAILVFHEPIEDWINRLVIPSFPIEARRASFEEMASAARERYPKGLLALKPSRETGELAIANIYMGNESHCVLLNPHTGAVLQVRHRQGTLMQLIGRFHSNLFLQRPGRVANGWLAIVTLVMAVTGILVWWPGQRVMSVNFRRPWRVWIWQLHNAAGFWCLFYIVLSAVTGAYFTWPQQYRAAISTVSTVTPRAAVRVEAPVGAVRRPLDELVAAAERALPALPIHEVTLTSDANQPVRIVKIEGHTPSSRTLSFVAVNPYTAEVLAVERPASKTAGDVLFGWIAPLHTGHFGGTFVAVLWAVLGLSMPLLFVSGFVMWWNRVVAKRL